MKKIICVLFVILLGILPLSSCGLKKIPSAKYVYKEQSVDTGTVAETKDYELRYDSDNACVSLYDKTNNALFSTTIAGKGEVKYDEFGMPIKNHPKAESSINVEYIVPDTGVIESLTGYSDCITLGNYSAENIEKGICVTYYFDTAKIAIPVNYTIGENGLVISIDPKKIMENENKVFQIYIAPLLCSVASNSNNGYIFVPSGSGGLIYPEQTESAIGKTYTTSIYGEDPVIAPQYQTTYGVRASAKIPVFGAVDNGTGICAIIENGAEASLVSAQVGVQKIPYSFVGAVWRIRSYQNVIHSIGISQKTENKFYSDNKVEEELKISYIPLYGEKASYSGMAEIYRDYLYGGNDKNTVKDSIYSLKVIGGVVVNSNILGVPYDKLVCTTSIADAKNIAEELKKSIGETADMLLVGYGKTGISVGKRNSVFTIPSKLGKTDDLKELSSYLDKNNSTLYFDYDILTSTENDSKTALSADGKSLEITQKELWSGMKNSTAKTYLMNSRLSLPSFVDKAIDKAKKYEIKGIGFSSLSNTAYSDYADKKYYVKSNSGTDFSSFAKLVKNNNLKLAGSSANAYAAINCSKVFDVPMYSDNDDLIAAEVPFYQMIFKGKTSLASTSVNYSTNEKTAILKAAESGIGLSYTLYNEFESKLTFSSNYDFTAGEYDGIKKDIIARVSEYKDYFNLVNGSAIKENTVISESVHKTAFENGVTVYVNYGITPYETPFGTLKGMEYIYGKGE